jgi:hypothetical protein
MITTSALAAIIATAVGTPAGDAWCSRLAADILAGHVRVTPGAMADRIHGDAWYPERGTPPAGADPHQLDAAIRDARPGAGMDVDAVRAEAVARRNAHLAATLGHSAAVRARRDAVQAWEANRTAKALRSAFVDPATDAAMTDAERRVIASRQGRDELRPALETAENLLHLALIGWGVGLELR